MKSVRVYRKGLSKNSGNFLEMSSSCLYLKFHVRIGTTTEKALSLVLA